MTDHEDDQDIPIGQEDMAGGSALAQPERMRLWFAIDHSALPPDTTWVGDLELALVALSPDEELEAAKRGRGEQAGSFYEFAKMALVGVREPVECKPFAPDPTKPKIIQAWKPGRARDVKRDEMEQESIWSQIGPKGRNLLMAAFQEVAAAGEDAVAKMRKSFRWSTGS